MKLSETEKNKIVKSTLDLIQKKEEEKAARKVSKVTVYKDGKRIGEFMNEPVISKKK